MLPPFIQAIGSDRFLSLAEVTGAAGDPVDMKAAWDLYVTAFGGFAETTIDPLFHRFSHPSRWLGSLSCDRDASVVVWGTGPSAMRELPALQRLRPFVHVITSPRGADVLAAQGIAADVVLIEHRTALDAHHSVCELRDGAGRGTREAALVAADWRTPRALLSSVRPDALFIPEPLPTWGFWPATAVALAAQSGCGAIGLVGVDLGTEERADPAFAPLRQLLELLAQITSSRSPSGPDPILTVDCGGALKKGWRRASLDTLTPRREISPIELKRRPAPPPAARQAAAAAAVDHLAPTIERSRQILDVALAARAGSARTTVLTDAAAEILSWQHEARVRVSLQEDLGLAFLPRLWRTGIDLSLGSSLWRFLTLATHELVAQADRLQASLLRSAA